MSESYAENHKAGFVNIIGLPNVGKSTLVNALMKEKLSIVTPKAQTTRHRILGIINEPEYQLVISDSPGFVSTPAYELHEAMNRFVQASFEDADVIIYMIMPGQKDTFSEELIAKLVKAKCPLFALVNKVDLCEEEEKTLLLNELKERLPNATAVLPVSALEKIGIDDLLEKLLAQLPVHPPFFPKDEMSDKTVRFFVSEIVREKIFLNYKQEIPYGTEVVVESYKESPEIIRIRAVIYGNQKSHKAILIGKGGKALKRVGIASRKDIEEFVGKHVHLELFVKIRENWRDKPGNLRSFGFQ